MELLIHVLRNFPDGQLGVRRITYAAGEIIFLRSTRSERRQNLSKTRVDLLELREAKGTVLGYVRRPCFYTLKGMDRKMSLMRM